MKTLLNIMLLVPLFNLAATSVVFAGVVRVSGDNSDFFQIAHESADVQYSLSIMDDPVAETPTASRVFIEEGAVAIFGNYDTTPYLITPEGFNVANTGPDGMTESWENANLRILGLPDEPYRVTILVEEGEPLTLRTNHGVKEMVKDSFSIQFAGGRPQIYDLTRLKDVVELEIPDLENFFTPGSVTPSEAAATTEPVQPPAGEDV